jgi:hypothetical protein
MPFHPALPGRMPPFPVLELHYKNATTIPPPFSPRIPAQSSYNNGLAQVWCNAALNSNNSDLHIFLIAIKLLRNLRVV